MLSFSILILMRSPNTSRGCGRDSTSQKRWQILAYDLLQSVHSRLLQLHRAFLSEVNVVAIWNWLINWFIYSSQSVAKYKYEYLCLNWNVFRERGHLLVSSLVSEGARGCTSALIFTEKQQDLWFVHYYSRALSTFLPPSVLCCMHRCSRAPHISLCVCINEMTPPYFCGLKGVCNKILFTSCHSSCEKLHRLRGHCCPGLRSLFLRRLSGLGN